jgi:energy-coupling factor transporter ATP-binding protein EcfA2
MDDVLENIILGRLDADDKLAERTRALVLGACHGAEALDASLEGKPSKSPKEAGAKAPSARNPAYIRSIEVQGFRGVGPSASLPITTGPGLTLVVGRNGSGKSSFAEALELLLTGDNSRWSTRSAIWKEGWRNLHQSNTRIDAEFVVEGAKGTTVVSREWKPDAKLEEADTVVSAQGSKKSDLETMGWAGAVEMYRPFLSYSELGSMLDAGPSALYDALSAILGLEELIEAEARLKEGNSPTRRRSLCRRSSNDSPRSKTSGRTCASRHCRPRPGISTRWRRPSSEPRRPTERRVSSRCFDSSRSWSRPMPMR